MLAVARRYTQTQHKNPVHVYPLFLSHISCSAYAYAYASPSIHTVISAPARLAPAHGHTYPLWADTHGHNHGPFRVQMPVQMPMPMSVPMGGAGMPPMMSLSPPSPYAPRVNARVARRSGFFPVPDVDGTHEYEYEE